MKTSPDQLTLEDVLRLPAKVRLPCPCDCGEIPKGQSSRFCQGHDTRFYVRFAKEHGADEATS